MVPEILMSVASHAVQIHSRQTDLKKREVDLRALAAQLDYQASRDDLQAETARKLIDSLISASSERVGVVQSAFMETLKVIKDQADHFMRQQGKLEDAKSLCTDTLVLDRYSARIYEIDMQLGEIRQQAMALHQEMNKTILLIGGTMPPLGGDFQRVLMLN